MDNKTALQNIARFTQDLSTLLFVAVLYVGKDVLIPIALSGLFAFLLSPLVNRLQRMGLSNLLAVLVTAATVFGGLTILILAIWGGIQEFDTEMPKYRAEFRKKLELGIHTLRRAGGAFTSITTTVEEIAENNVNANDGNPNGLPKQAPASGRGELRSSSDAAPSDVPAGSTPEQPLYVLQTGTSGIDYQSWVGGIAAVLGPIGNSGLVTVIIIFFLLFRDDIRDRFTGLIARGNYVMTAEAVDEASRRISKYLFTQLMLNLSYGICFGIGLSLIGYFLTTERSFPYLVLFSALAGLARFVPYVGPIFAAFVPLVFALIVFPGYSVLFAIAVLIVTMELLSNNVVEPWMYGSSSGVSPLAVILAAVFWYWLWGPIGLLLSTPLTVCAVVLGKYVPRFKFLTTLLSGENPIKPSVRAYQRLLPGDDLKVRLLFRDELERMDAVQFLDQTVIPLIKLVLNEDDIKRQHIMFERLAASLSECGLIDSINGTQAVQKDGVETLKDVSALENAIKATPPDPLLPLGAAIAVRHEGESIIVRAIDRQLHGKVRLMVYDGDDLPDREATQIVAANPNFVFICVIPPNGFSQASFWCRALRKAGYHGTILVGCFGKFRNFDRMHRSFRQSGANWMMTSTEQTLRKLPRILQRESLRQLPNRAAGNPTAENHESTLQQT